MTGRTAWLLALALLACGMTVKADPGSVSLQYRVVNGFPVKFVVVNMNDPDVVVTTAVATSFPHGLERWDSLLQRLHPDAAINGTYFCLHSYMPVGDIVIEGEPIYRGVVGTALCIAPNNTVSMRPGPRQAKPDWRHCRTVVCAGPRLLTDNQLTVSPREEGFRDPRVLGSAPRSAVAWRPDGTLLLLTIEKDISLTNLAWVCQELGAANAMALDGGDSSGLYAEGRTVTRPGRALSNIIAVYTSRSRFAQFSSRLSPFRLPNVASLGETPAGTSTSPAFVTPTTPAPELTFMDLLGKIIARQPVPVTIVQLPKPSPPVAVVTTLKPALPDVPHDPTPAPVLPAEVKPATPAETPVHPQEVKTVPVPPPPAESINPPSISPEPEPVMVTVQPTVITPPHTPPATSVPATPPPAPRIVPPVRFTAPNVYAPVSGVVPVSVEVAGNCHPRWISLYINGQLRMLETSWPLHYTWDSTEEADGFYTLEVTAWSADHKLLGHDIRQISVKNLRKNNA